MKLLVVSQYFWPENFRINDLVAELVVRGHKVTVLTGKPNYPEGVVFPDYANTPSAFATFAGAKVVRLPMLARGKGSFRLALNYASFALSGMCLAPFLLKGQRFDAIFVCQLSPVTSALPATILRQLRGIPSIIWVLDLWPQSLRAVKVVKSKALLGAIDWLAGFIYRHSDLVLGQSQSFLPELARHVPERRVGYWPSWSEPLPALEDAQPAPEIALRPDLFNIVFTGNIGEAQDFPAVLQAAELLRQEPVRWLIVGDGRKAEWLRSEIALRGLADNFILSGRFPLERMPSFFRHADALLVSLRTDPALSSTIPGKLQAYLAAGKPILAMLDGEGAKLVLTAKAGYAVAAGDSTGLAVAVSQLAATSAEGRLAMARNGRDYSAREFDRSLLISQLEERLSALVLDRTGPRQRAA